MPDSNFSMQVTQPSLNNPFPVVKRDAIDDRLFRHITFPESDTDATYRLRAIDNNDITSTTVTQKEVATSISIVDKFQEKFRIKAVLSEKDHGIDESYWVTTDAMDSPDIASSHNQYRMRGISTEGWKSDWVYSELRDIDNDLIIYNMLYDVMDLLLSVHDDQIDYLMDYITQDTFINILRDQLPFFERSLDPDEFQTAGLAELVRLLSSAKANPHETMMAQLGESFMALSSELKREFNEGVMASPEEFSELFKVFQLFDRYKSGNQSELVGLIMEIFLEDRLEKVVQKTDIEAILKNDEEMGIYLNGKYELDIKSELIKAIYSASPDDSFVSNIYDAVSLLSEPVVSETIKLGKSEETETFFRMALQELFVPTLALEERFIELESALEDEHKTKATGSIVEFATILSDGSEIRNMLLYDMADALIKGDLAVATYQVEFIEKILRNITDSRKSVLIDYQPEEFFRILLDMGESFQYEYKKAFMEPKEFQTAGLLDSYSLISEPTRTFKDVYKTTFEDSAILAQIKDPSIHNESTQMSLIDIALQQYTRFKNTIEEALKSSLQESHLHGDVSPIRQLLEDAHVGVEELFISKDARDKYGWKESKTGSPSEAYDNLFSHFLREPNRYPILEDLTVDIGQYPQDKFFLDGSEIVQYTVGDLGGDWPISTFKLGTNTLKG